MARQFVWSWLPAAIVGGPSHELAVARLVRPAGVTDAVLADHLAANDGLSQFTSSAFSDIYFPNPSTALTVNTGGDTRFEDNVGSNTPLKSLTVRF